MTKVELHNKLVHLLDNLTEDQIKENICTLLKTCACKLIESDVDEGENFLEYVAGLLNYDNFVTESEYKEIDSRLRVSVQYKSVESFKEHFSDLHKNVESSEHFNVYALMLVMNDIIKTHKQCLLKYIEESELENIVYDLAVVELSSKGKWLREKYHLL